jgi:hypothetical protein
MEILSHHAQESGEVTASPGYSNLSRFLSIALSRSFGALTHITMCHIVFDVRIDGRPPIMAENEV